ncbi:hypothetical protein ACFQH8_10635 [Halomicroarcula sp. GCM10025710]
MGVVVHVGVVVRFCVRLGIPTLESTVRAFERVGRRMRVRFGPSVVGVGLLDRRVVGDGSRSHRSVLVSVAVGSLRRDVPVVLPLAAVGVRTPASGSRGVEGPAADGALDLVSVVCVGHSWLKAISQGAKTVAHELTISCQLL